MKKVFQIYLFIVTMVIFSACSKDLNMTIKVENQTNEKIREFSEGYVVANYDVYDLPAKENGRKYDKVYVVGKFENEFFEDGEYIVNYLVDNEGNKYWLRLDSKKSDISNELNDIVEKNLCVCGIYLGRRVKEKMPAIIVKKLLCIENDKIYSSKYFEGYEGEFDENGKIISKEYDESDNTTVDYYKIQFGIPYNYKEKFLSEDGGLYYIHEDAFLSISRKKYNLSNIMNNTYKKIKYFESLKNVGNLKSLLGEIGIGKIDEINDIRISESKNYLICKSLFNSNEKNTIMNIGLKFKQDEIYILYTMYSDEFRFNIDDDFNKIMYNMKKWDVPHKPQSYGTNKMVYEMKDDIANINIKKNDNSFNQEKNVSTLKNSIETFGGIKFEVPGYFDVRKVNYDIYDVVYYPEIDKASATLGFKVIKTNSDSKALKNSKDNIIKEWKGKLNNLKTEEKTINNVYILFGSSKTNEGNVKCACFANDNMKQLLLVIIMVDSIDTTNNNYINDFDNMIKNMSFDISSNNMDNSTSGGTSNNIKGIIDDYNKEIDKAKVELNSEIDNAAESVKKELGVLGNLYDNAIDDYVDVYKDILNDSADIYKDTANNYGKLYENLYDKYGY